MNNSSSIEVIGLLLCKMFAYLVDLKPKSKLTKSIYFKMSSRKEREHSWDSTQVKIESICCFCSIVFQFFFFFNSIVTKREWILVLLLN